MNIATKAAEMRDTETSIDKALTKLERFQTTLSNLAVEVLQIHIFEHWNSRLSLYNSKAIDKLPDTLFWFFTLF